MLLNALITGEEQTSLPLVILHGLLGSADNWRSASKAWARERKVIALDLRNHGKSGHVNGMNYGEMANDVLETLTSLGVEAFDLIGHSMGGKTAITVACAAPDRVNKLVVEDIAPIAYKNNHQHEFDAMREVAKQTIQQRSDADKIMQPFLPDKAVRLFIATNLIRQEDGSLTWRVPVDIIESHYGEIGDKPPLKHKFSHPVLFVKGDHSNYVTEEGIAAASNIFPDMKVVSISAGHWVHAEKFTEFKKVVDDFLAG